MGRYRPIQTSAMICLLLMEIAPALKAAEPADQLAHNQLTASELTDGWILLFDGETLFGWQPNSKVDWTVADGVISASEGEKGLLNTTSPFGDFRLKFDFRRAEKTNSGVFLRTVPEPTDPQLDCYELNIAAPDVSPWPTGSFARRQKDTDSADKADQWSAVDVTAVGGHFVVAIDGKKVLDYTDPKPLGRGLIGLQFNTGKIEFRSIKLKPLSLDELLVGNTGPASDPVDGWTVYPDKNSTFTITDGTLNVKGGSGQLESREVWRLRLADRSFFQRQVSELRNFFPLYSGPVLAGL